MRKEKASKTVNRLHQLKPIINSLSAKKDTGERLALSNNSDPDKVIIMKLEE